MTDTESIINWKSMDDDELRSELTAGMKELDARKEKKAKAKNPRT